MRRRHSTHFLAIGICLTAGAGCEDVTAPEAAHAIAAVEDRLAREWVADPSTFPEAESIWIVADLARHGSEGVPVTITIDGRDVPFMAVAYESAKDPFVLTAEGRVVVWRRGLVAWRGTPAEEVIAVWAREPGAIARPSFLHEPEDPSRIFSRPRAFRVRRDTTRWSGVEGMVSVGEPVFIGPCRFRTERAEARRRARSATPAVACATVTFEASFDLVVERHDPAIILGLHQELMDKQLTALPFRGISPTRISMKSVHVPGIRFVNACGTAHGAPNDSTCLSTDARPSP